MANKAIGEPLAKLAGLPSLATATRVRRGRFAAIGLDGTRLVVEGLGSSKRGAIADAYARNREGAALVAAVGGGPIVLRLTAAQARAVSAGEVSCEALGLRLRRTPAGAYEPLRRGHPGVATPRRRQLLIRLTDTEDAAIRGAAKTRGVKTVDWARTTLVRAAGG